MLAVIHIGVLAGLLWYGYRQVGEPQLRPYYWPAALIKLAAGAGVGLLYLYYYRGGDTWQLFQQAELVAGRAFTSWQGFLLVYGGGDLSTIPGFAYTWQPRASFMVRLLAPLAWLTGGSYWLTGAYLSIFSLRAMWLLARTAWQQWQRQWPALLPALFLPSLVFWTSGVLKESVAIGCMAVVLALAWRLYQGSAVGRWQAVGALLAWLVLAMLRYYYAALLAVTLLAYVMAAYLPTRIRKKYGVRALLLFFILLLFAGSLLHINLWPSRLPAVLAHNYYQAVLASGWQKVVQLPGLEGDFLSLLLYSPWALWQGLFAPLWLEPFGWPRLLAVAENWLVLVALANGLRDWRWPAAGRTRLWVTAWLLFVITAAILLVYASPNLGTLSRIRSGYYLVWGYLIAALYAGKRPERK